MKLIENRLFIDMPTMVELGFSENYLWKAKSTGTKCWLFINDPTDKRKVLISYEDLKEEYRQRIKGRYGNNPYDHVVRLPILKMIELDGKANEYYRTYEYNGNIGLDPRTIDKYTRAASWLNMLKEMDCKKKIQECFKGLTRPDFFTHVRHLIEIEKQNGKDENYKGLQLLAGNFPGTYQNLMAKLETYQNEGYESLIDASTGNKSAAKVGRIEGGFDPATEMKMIAIIRKISTLHNNLDAAQVTMHANKVFVKNNWCELSKSTVYDLMKKHGIYIAPGRRGRKAFNSEIAKQVKRKAPDFPTYYFTLDGWTAELLYSENGEYKRLVIVVVLDAMNKYPIGYAIGDRETTELIREANRNALLHLQELFGDRYRAYQLQSDRYGLKNLTPFYQAVAHLHTPAAVGNAKSKIIEPYFKYLQKKYCQLLPNWSGFNITASKKNQVNAEMLNLIKHSFPNKAGVMAQLENIMQSERRLKIGEYMQQWAAMPVENRSVMSDMDWVIAFGQLHLHQGKPVTNKLRGEGLVTQIGGVKYWFDSFDRAFCDKINSSWQLVYEPENMTRVVAISPDGKEKHLLQQTHVSAMDILSTTEADLEHQFNVRAFNKQREADIINIIAKDAEIVSEVVNNTPLDLAKPDELALKLMLTYNGQQKEAIQDAKGLKRIAAKAEVKEQKKIAAEKMQSESDWQAMQVAFLQSKTDFNQFLD